MAKPARLTMFMPKRISLVNIAPAAAMVRSCPRRPILSYLVALARVAVLDWIGYPELRVPDAREARGLLQAYRRVDS